MSNKRLSQLLTKDKFIEGNTIYTGVQDNALRIQLQKLIDKSINEFITATQENASIETLQDMISIGLSRFNPYDLDTEERERVCEYYEEIKDAINMESSGGVINKWLYGFDF